jgi:hypothetical protein
VIDAFVDAQLLSDLGFKTITVDTGPPGYGSKFKVVNRKDNNYAPKKLQFHIALVEKLIENYLQQVDVSDNEDGKTIDEKPIVEMIGKLKQVPSELKALEYDH